MPLYFPMQSSSIDQESADFFIGSIQMPLLIARIMILVLLAVGGGLIVGVIVTCICWRYQEKPKPVSQDYQCYHLMLAYIMLVMIIKINKNSNSNSNSKFKIMGNVVTHRTKSWALLERTKQFILFSPLPLQFKHKSVSLCVMSPQKFG